MKKFQAFLLGLYLFIPYSAQAQIGPSINRESLAIPSTPLSTPESIKSDLDRLHHGIPNVFTGSSNIVPPAMPPSTAGQTIGQTQVTPIVPPINSAPTIASPVLTPVIQAPRNIPGQSKNSAGCTATNDLSMLLSPACLDSLRALGVPKGMAEGLSTGAPSGGSYSTSRDEMQCSVAVFTGDRGTIGVGMVSFKVPNLARCVEAGARLSFGLPASISNIIATDMNSDVISVACKRDTIDGKRLSCQAQPAIMAARDEPVTTQPIAQPVTEDRVISSSDQAVKPLVEQVIRGPAQPVADQSVRRAHSRANHKH